MGKVEIPHNANFYGNTYIINISFPKESVKIISAILLVIFLRLIDTPAELITFLVAAVFKG